MVAVPEPLAADVALGILRSGGNAVDAAVAAGFALAVTHPAAGNLGGGGFMLVRLSGGESWVIDYRETAPSAATKDMFLDASGKARASLSVESYLAVGVPGTVAGLALARERAGTIPLGRLIAPPATLASEGFPLRPALARSLVEHREQLARHPSSARIFLPGGKAPEPGSLLVQEDLARTLRLIARDGASAFYEGPVAASMEEIMRERGGRITRADMAAYRALVREPLRARYRDLDVISAPPPSAGGIVLTEMLHMLEPYNLRDLGRGSSAYLHLLAEVMKRAYADRAVFLGDPDHVDVPVEQLLSPAYARSLMSGYDPGRATPADAAGPGDPLRFEGDSTTHFTIVDALGNVVVNTYTLNDSFGLGAVLDGWGFLLNNEMDDFSSAPGTPNMYGLVGAEANAISPGKRMLSSMTPTIILKSGRPWLALGTPGGGRITTMVLQVLLNVAEFGMELQAAVDAPRCHHQWKPDRISCEEEALPADVRAALEARGHTVQAGSHHGDIQAILIEPETGLLRGAADARGSGVAIGY